MCSFRLPYGSIKQPLASITRNTFRHCRIRFFAFVGQPFSKQLYLFSFTLAFSVVVLVQPLYVSIFSRLFLHTYSVYFCAWLRRRELEGNHVTTLFTLYPAVVSAAQARLDDVCSELFHVLAIDSCCRILNLRVNAVFLLYWRYHYSMVIPTGLF